MAVWLDKEFYVKTPFITEVIFQCLLVARVINWNCDATHILDLLQVSSDTAQSTEHLTQIV